MNFSALRQEDLLVAIAVGGMFLFALAAIFAAVAHFYARARLARPASERERRPPRRDPRGRR